MLIGSLAGGLIFLKKRIEIKLIRKCKSNCRRNIQSSSNKIKHIIFKSQSNGYDIAKFNTQS